MVKTCQLGFINFSLCQIKYKSNAFVFYCQGFANELVNESLNNSDARLLSVAFLVIRQVSLQGGHVFQPYVTWFQVSVICVGNV